MYLQPIDFTKQISHALYKLPTTQQINKAAILHSSNYKKIKRPIQFSAPFSKSLAISYLAK